jgi:hypothetical protein
MRGTTSLTRYSNVFAGPFFYTNNEKVERELLGLGTSIILNNG